MPGRQIDDGQAAVPEAHPQLPVGCHVLEITLIVRAAMRDRIVHPAQCSSGVRDVACQ
jgi:hypothetical protein